jgi:Fe-S oxidoreductase
MWMEEKVGTKVNTARSRELLDTGAERIAVACPYCYIMIDDGVKEHGRDDVIVQDISMHLLDAIEGEHAVSQQPPAHPGTDLHEPSPSDEPAAT